MPGGQHSARRSMHSHWKKSGCCCRLGTHTQYSSPVPPRMPSLSPMSPTHSWNHHCSTCSSLRSSSWWQAKSWGGHTLSSTSSSRVSLWGHADGYGGSPKAVPTMCTSSPVLVLGQLLLLPGRVAPTKAFVLRSFHSLGMQGGWPRHRRTPQLSPPTMVTAPTQGYSAHFPRTVLPCTLSFPGHPPASPQEPYHLLRPPSHITHPLPSHVTPRPPPPNHATPCALHAITPFFPSQHRLHNPHVISM